MITRFASKMAQEIFKDANVCKLDGTGGRGVGGGEERGEHSRDLMTLHTFTRRAQNEGRTISLHSLQIKSIQRDMDYRYVSVNMYARWLAGIGPKVSRE